MCKACIGEMRHRDIGTGGPEGSCPPLLMKLCKNASLKSKSACPNPKVPLLHTLCAKILNIK